MIWTARFVQFTKNVLHHVTYLDKTYLHNKFNESFQKVEWKKINRFTLAESPVNTSPINFQNKVKIYGSKLNPFSETSMLIPLFTKDMSDRMHLLCHSEVRIRLCFESKK